MMKETISESDMGAINWKLGERRGREENPIRYATDCLTRVNRRGGETRRRTGFGCGGQKMAPRLNDGARRRKTGRAKLRGRELRL
ncbi:hypothetical protein Nepgr_025053 [Nepenthes gracilis]|uniref:Uncharacterized protein n=1 Tax=Nepenthes gracilis TaxID=150966 RepID=A0AAD3T4D2_NEPGR|nr:hypothetical protein Nepgr_025053 [Nepenthes gracilis]